MIRLKPSEITLTPADVEESRRRIMSRKQAVAPPPTLASSLSPRGPRLRRGPLRSRDDALQSLGNVPVLTPHKVVYASLDSDVELDQDDNPRDERESDRPERPSAFDDSQTEHNEPSTVHDLQLPIRLVPRRYIEHGRAASRSMSDSEPSPSPPKHHSRVSSFGRARTNTSEDHAEGAVQSRIQHSIDGSVEPHRVAEVGPRRTPPAHSARRQSNRGLSSVHRTRAVSPSVQQPIVGGSQLGRSQSKFMPTLFLQGYFVSPDRYTFRESLMMPHTEPRQRGGRGVPLARTMSSSSDPSNSMRETAHLRRTTPAADVFWPAPAATPLPRTDQVEVDGNQDREGDVPHSSFEERIRRVHTRLESIQGRTRDFFRGREGRNPDELGALAQGPESQRASEASSNTSLPYSYYELPPSRQSSSGHSQNETQLPQAQYDGAGPSNQVSRGAYFSIRPSQLHAADEGNQRPPLTRASSFSSPNLTAAPGQHGLSPRPTSPYTRVQSTHSTPREPVGLLTANDFLGDDRDAANAVERNLSSPLDLIEQRASIQLSRTLLAVPQVPPRPRSSVPFQYQVNDFDTGSRGQRTAERGGMRQQSGNSAHHRMTTTGRHPAEPQLTNPSPHRQERSPTHLPDPRRYPRGVAGVRSNQRSSENMPVGIMPPQSGRPVSRTAHERGPRLNTDRDQRARPSQGISMRGGDIPLNHGPTRPRMPYVTNAGEISRRQQGMSLYHRPSSRHHDHNQPRNDRLFSSSPIPPYRAYRNGSQRHAPAPGPTTARIRRSLTSSSPHPYNQTAHTYHHQPLERAPTHHHQGRPFLRPLPPLPSHPHHRPPIPTRIASRRRRISTQQQNQENSGDAEQELMREELRAARMRYPEQGDGVGLEVMDETPPRMGRFERRMLEG